jgi:hypothetical protein
MIGEDLIHSLDVLFWQIRDGFGGQNWGQTSAACGECRHVDGAASDQADVPNVLPKDKYTTSQLDPKVLGGPTYIRLIWPKIQAGADSVWRK